MRMHKSMDELFKDPGFRILMLDLLYETPELRPLGDAIKQAKEALLMQSGRRWSESDRFSQIQVAKAAGVRVSLIKKYIREGVRGAGRLLIDEEGNVSPFDLTFFASLHSGHARDVALKALGQLRRELAPNRTGKAAGPSRKLTGSNLRQGVRLCQEKPSSASEPRS